MISILTILLLLFCGIATGVMLTSMYFDHYMKQDENIFEYVTRWHANATGRNMIHSACRCHHNDERCGEAYDTGFQVGMTTAIHECEKRFAERLAEMQRVA